MNFLIVKSFFRMANIFITLNIAFFSIAWKASKKDKTHFTILLLKHCQSFS